MLNTLAGILILILSAIIVIVLTAIILIFIYLLIGLIVAMYHVSAHGEYDVFDFFGVFIAWPSFLQHKLMGKPWG